MILISMDSSLSLYSQIYRNYTTKIPLIPTILALITKESMNSTTMEIVRQNMNNIKRIGQYIVFYYGNWRVAVPCERSCRGHTHPCISQYSEWSTHIIIVEMFLSIIFISLQFSWNLSFPRYLSFLALPGTKKLGFRGVPWQISHIYG